MDSSVPPGHPGDVIWRLPLVRALQELGALKGPTQERALAAVKRGGFLSSHLVDAGVPADKVLMAMSVATGLQSASPREVRKPTPDMAELSTKEACRAMLAVPFKRGENGLQIAYVVPPSTEQTSVFPPHTAYVALEHDIRMGLNSLYGPEPKGNRTLASSTAPMTSIDAGGARTEPMTTPMAAATQDGKVVASESGNPSALEMARAGLIETGMSPMEETMLKLKALKWPLIFVVAAGLGVWGVGRLISHSSAEIDSKGSQLRDGLREAKEEAARDQARQLGQDPAPHLPGQGNLDALATSQADLDVAINGGQMENFFEACHRFSQNLSLYVVRAPSVQQQADLKMLSMEAMVLCESEHVTPPTEKWNDLKGRLNRVMRGENPRPGARYQIEMPPEVVRAISGVDEALTAQDVPAACKAISTFRSAMYQWMDRFPPGPRLMRMNRVVEEDIEMMMMSCNQYSPDALAGRWRRIKKEIGPEE